jgi:bifunctional UDP-N-acetylglucosamine pyrophosphorylase / glucosamine-1-phosphate N-acetyltransferase
MKAIVLAAGKSTRFKSNKHKALHDLLGKTILERILNTLWELQPKQIHFVLGYQLEQIAAILTNAETYIEQIEQLGTAHALQTGLKNLEDDGNGFFVTCVDTPLVRTETLKRLIKKTQDCSAAIGLLTANLHNPSGYGRIVKNENNLIQGIIEEKDLTNEQKQIQEVNAGLYYFNMPIQQLSDRLKSISNKNKQNEYYLTDIISPDLKIVSEICEDSDEILGINSRIDLEKAIQALNVRTIKCLQEKGVTFLSPESCLISPEAKIEADTIIGPNCQIYGSSQIGSNCYIAGNSFIQSSIIAENTQIRYSQIIESQIGNNCSIGPFANLRPGSQLANNVVIGDFVEVKNSQIAQNSKIPHLSYIGDSSIGEDVNIGAGTITANFDAISGNKNKTQIGNGVKIGSNSVLVAPIEIADNCFIGAGTIVTESVRKSNSLILSRCPQSIKEDWVLKKKEELG